MNSILRSTSATSTSTSASVRPSSALRRAASAAVLVTAAATTAACGDGAFSLAPDAGAADPDASGFPAAMQENEARESHGLRDAVDASDDSARGVATAVATGADAGQTRTTDLPVRPKPIAGKAAVDAGASVDAGPTCDTKVADEGIGVFLVSSPVPAQGACGLISNPCTDLASAIGALSDTRRTIYVGPGIYTPVPPAPEVPLVPEGVTVIGGWNVTNSPEVGYSFTPTCTPNATFASAAPVVLAVGSRTSPSASTVTLDTVGVVSTATAAAGQSLYGIFAVGNSSSSLVLRHVSVSVPNGGDGVAGVTGTPGVAGGAGDCDPLGDSAAGATGGGGGATAFGPGGATGGAPGPTGTAGSMGAAGTPGTEACRNENGGATGCSMVVNVSTTGITEVCEAYGAGPVCSAAPAAGCGGAGGGAGTGGGGGGSSVAVYEWGGQLVLDSGVLIAGKGGTGGVGGAGGAGGMGGREGNPVTVTYPSRGGCNLVDNECVMTSTLSVTASPATGGTVGGVGGQGGGGVGGDSYAYYLGGGASATLSADLVFTPGVAGAGGVGGLPNGTQGYAGPTNTQD